jgi:hypothetical protein
MEVTAVNNLIRTNHSVIRKQQRGVPPLIEQWLLDYGDEQYDGHGAVVRYFSNDAIKRLKREIGNTPLKRMHEFLRCYLVQSSRNGAVITVGKRHANRKIRKH